jgi:hypothetical protein
MRISCRAATPMKRSLRINLPLEVLIGKGVLPVKLTYADDMAQ